MITYLIHILFFIIFKHFNAELSLPSYEFSAGEWPQEYTAAQKIVENLMDRWFIDIKDAKCKPFEYRGTKGNFNNFPSQKLCERHLNTELNHVEKLKGCKQKPNNNDYMGACIENKSNLSEKYYFNMDDGTCTSFKYNKCGGTFNRYDSEDECKAYCLNGKNGGVDNTILSNKISSSSENQKYTLPNYLDCHLKPDVIKHNPDTKVIALVDKKKCVYASVNTELERGYFETLRKCVETCFPKYNNDTDENSSPLIKRKVAACDTDKPYQYASGGDSKDLIKYYYDKSSKKCKRFETGPSSSNNDVFNSDLNNFPTLDLCHSYCGTENYPDKIITEKTCQMEKKGEFLATTSPTPVYKVKRYYYMEDNNGAIKKCKTFYYTGIEGNTNNFKTLEECKAICGNNMRPDDVITDDQSDTNTSV